jgi:FdhE protein
MTRDVWLARHPFLQPVADLHSQVDTALAEVFIPSPAIPLWDDYLDDFYAGVPLLQSSKVAIDLNPVGITVAALLEELASKSLPGRLGEETRALDAELHQDPDAPRRAVAWLFASDSFAPTCPGLLQYLSWTVLAHYLHPIVGAFESWRDEERWLRNYCVTCGAPPAMAQLVGTDPGRLRFLSCGRCGTHWRYRRTGCPFCEKRDDHRLAVVAVEGEDGLRIDHCEACGGYLKTYNGEGSESVLLADWTSLHLDVVALDRGLKRRALSLYEL